MKVFGKAILLSSFFLFISYLVFSVEDDYFLSSELLGRPTNNSISIELIPAQDLEVFIEYGTAMGKYPSKTTPVSASKEATLEITLSKLKGNKQYYYRVNYRIPDSSNYKTGSEGTFHTQRKKKDEFIFSVISDSHLSQTRGIPAFEKALENISLENPDFLLDLGDTFMTDTLDSYTRESILERMLMTRNYFQNICHSIPIFLALGNHAGESAFLLGTRRDALPTLATLLRKELFPNPTPDSFYTGNSSKEEEVGLRENYYAWTWGSAQFIVLDPFWYTETNPMRSKDNWDRSLGETQYKWLLKTLRNSKSNFKFVFIHNLVGGIDNYGRGGAEAVPFYEWGGNNQDGSYGFDSQRPGWEAPIHDLLTKYNVNIVFHGHDHSYARQEMDGIIYQLLPQPGKTKTENEAEAIGHGYKSGTILTGSGHLRVTVNRKSVLVEFIASSTTKGNGEVLHSYEIKK